MIIRRKILTIVLSFIFSFNCIFIWIPPFQYLAVEKESEPEILQSFCPWLSKVQVTMTGPFYGPVRKHNELQRPHNKITVAVFITKNSPSKKSELPDLASSRGATTNARQKKLVL